MSHHQTRLALSHVLCAPLFLSLSFLYLSRSLCSNLRGTQAHPQQAKRCPTERHRTPRITLKWAAYSGFWQLNYGWSACPLSLGCWGWNGDVTFSKFKVFLGLRKYGFVKYSWDIVGLNLLILQNGSRICTNYLSHYLSVYTVCTSLLTEDVVVQIKTRTVLCLDRSFHLLECFMSACTLLSVIHVPISLSLCIFQWQSAPRTLSGETSGLGWRSLVFNGLCERPHQWQGW